MTVSNVLNNRPVVQPATREAVLKAVKTLNYTPNSAARALASAATLRIGLIHHGAESALLSAILVGTLRAVSRLGAQLVMDTYDSADPIAGVERFLKMDLDGLLLPPPLCEMVSAAGLPERYDTKMIALAPGGELPNMDCVRIDDEQATYEITRILLEKGHRRIGLVTLPGALVAVSRLRGYLRALGEFGIAPDMNLVWEARPTFDAGLELAERVLVEDRDATAVLAGNDDMAAAFVNVALRQNLSIPDDISIIGFDDSPIAVKIWPSLTTVRQPLAQIAEQATDRLVDALRNPNSANQISAKAIYVDFEVIERLSVGTARS
ncbi:LacI family transcriptional regulator [Novosphingobium sp. PY1]|nr:LacI family transcriptional regulator [Novosphingobium sp. PY1]GFM31355.1 LacI family transcriptional regulator [Novosphingobium sp. PY1]